MKNHDFTPKKSDFFQMQGEARNFLGYLVWKITILRQKIIFFPILGGARPGSAPVIVFDIIHFDISEANMTLTNKNVDAHTIYTSL